MTNADLDAEPIRRGGRQGSRGYEFELTGGALCLDLANTVDSRGTETPRELLSRYEDLLAWGRQSGALDEAQAARLEKRAAREPRDATAALRRARETREALFRVCSAEAGGAEPPADAVARVDEDIRAALARRRLEPLPGGGFAWAWEADPALDRVLWPALLSAAELLTGAERGRIRECAAEECRWLFLDRSKNASRRWCDMTVCGNRAKARRHRDRQREAG